MKIASFNDFRVGIVDGMSLYDVTEVLPRFLDTMPRQRINFLIARWEEFGPRLADYRNTGTQLALDTVCLRSPNPAPQHVFAAPANYRKHIGELGDRSVTSGGRSAREQGFFLKAPGSLIGAGESIVLPRGSARRFDHESELAVIIGREARHVSRNDAMSYVFGYSCLIDVTMRIEKGVGEEERSMRKSFQSFTPMGPYLVTADEVKQPDALQNRLWVNDEIRHHANTGEMIVGIAELIELVSSVLTLQPGDVIASGTPEGVGPIQSGDRLRIELESVGSMTLPVKECDTQAPRPF